MGDSHKAPILGIDLGTTKSMACVALEGKDRPTIIRPHPRLLGDWMPSVFCMTEDGPKVGKDAEQLLNDDQYREDVVQCVKRFMRHKENLFPRYDPQYSARGVSAYILGHLRERAEKELGLSPGSITRAVVTVPAYFGFTEREQTRLAARDAGFDDKSVSLVDEPIAAAIGLGLHRMPGARLVMLIDLGGGTLDVTLLHVGADVGKDGFMELGRDGHDALGGLNWDEEIAKVAVREHDISPDALNPDNIALYGPAEEIKIFFCTSSQKDERLLSFYDRDSKKVLDTIVRRTDFVRNTQSLAERCGKICDRLLRGLHESDLTSLREKRRRLGGLLPGRRLRKIGWKDLDDVIMVGGGSWGRDRLEFPASRRRRQPGGRGARRDPGLLGTAADHPREAAAPGGVRRGLVGGPKVRGEPSAQPALDRPLVLPRWSRREAQVQGPHPPERANRRKEQCFLPVPGRGHGFHSRRRVGGRATRPK